MEWCDSIIVYGSRDTKAYVHFEEEENSFHFLVVYPASDVFAVRVVRVLYRKSCIDVWNSED